jgi:hypothetical protein
MFVGSLTEASEQVRAVSLALGNGPTIMCPSERSEFLDSANPGESYRTLQAPPQRVRELGERESANAIAPGVGVLRAPFPHEA